MFKIHHVLKSILKISSFICPYQNVCDLYFNWNRFVDLKVWLLWVYRKTNLNRFLWIIFRRKLKIYKIIKKKPQNKTYPPPPPPTPLKKTTNTCLHLYLVFQTNLLVLLILTFVWELSVLLHPHHSLCLNPGC